MNEAAKSFAWRVGICLLVSWLSWRTIGAVGLAISAALYGMLLAKPLYELAGELRDRLRAAAWKPVQGQFWAYRGVPVQVIEDDTHRRWIRVADVRKIVGFTASDGALRLTYPDGWRVLGTPAVPHIDDTALLAHLAKENSQAALKFRHWVEREIAFPARRLRGQ